MLNSVPACRNLFQKFMFFQIKLSRNAEAMDYCVKVCQNEQVKKISPLYPSIKILITSDDKLHKMGHSVSLHSFLQIILYKIKDPEVWHLINTQSLGDGFCTSSLKYEYLIFCQSNKLFSLP